jgi:hypothetical protein
MINVSWEARQLKRKLVIYVREAYDFLPRIAVAECAAKRSARNTLVAESARERVVVPGVISFGSPAASSSHQRSASAAARPRLVLRAVVRANHRACTARHQSADVVLTNPDLLLTVHSAQDVQQITQA